MMRVKAGDKSEKNSEQKEEATGSLKKPILEFHPSQESDGIKVYKIHKCGSDQAFQRYLKVVKLINENAPKINK